jgi:transcription-repair coupling factor (superfamily II helicase)
VLVPTTILAEQHWNTFRERFAPYPVRVEMLSRFRSPTQQKAVLAGLAAGTIDVVIGTHRLLSKDVSFKNLGLLVVDEEHRFGVAHKERMKQLRKSVHVLTLTATPIPRTLSMAMAGIRDLSVIESPPADRLAVETVVSRFDARVIKEAIERELGRGARCSWFTTGSSRCRPSSA